MAVKKAASEKASSMGADTVTEAASVEEEKAVTAKLQTVEKWAEQKGTNRAVFAGVKVMQRWSSGKSVSENDYVAAVAAFEKGPADGRKE